MLRIPLFVTKEYEGIQNVMSWEKNMRQRRLQHSLRDWVGVGQLPSMQFAVLVCNRLTWHRFWGVLFWQQQQWRWWLPIINRSKSDEMYSMSLNCQLRIGIVVAEFFVDAFLSRFAFLRWIDVSSPNVPLETTLRSGIWKRRSHPVVSVGSNRTAINLFDSSLNPLWTTSPTYRERHDTSKSFASETCVMRTPVIRPFVLTWAKLLTRNGKLAFSWLCINNNHRSNEKSIEVFPKRVDEIQCTRHVSLRKYFTCHSRKVDNELIESW